MRRLLRGEVRRVGPSWLRQFIWDAEFRIGKWDFLRPPEGLVELLVSTMNPGSSLLDLGCGTGGLIASLRSRGRVGPFVGVDISNQALRLAARRGLGNCRWIHADLRDFTTDTKYDVVTIVEAIYYLDLEVAAEFLRRAKTFLTPTGVIAIRVHSQDEYKDYSDVIRSILPGSREFPTDDVGLYFVFRADGRYDSIPSGKAAVAAGQ